MSFVDSVVQSHAVPPNALTTLTGAQTRPEIAQHFHDIVSALTDLHTRIMVLEHPGATPALVRLARQLADANLALTVAQEQARNAPSDANLARVTLQQQAIAALKASAPAAARVPAGESDVSAVLQDLLTSPNSPAQDPQ